MSKSPIKTIIRSGKLTVKGGTAAERAEARDSWDDAIGDYRGERNRTAQARYRARWYSEPSGMKVLRLYADALGESRFETTPMPMALKEFAPPAAPLRVSDPQPAQNYVILEVGAKWGGAVPHPSPARMMAFSLSGCTRVTASSGESHTFVAGDCLLLDDTAGKGHSTEVISDPARWVFICLPN